MDSSAQAQGSGGERPHGFSKFVRRASKALKPKSNRNSLASERAGTAEDSTATQEMSSTSAAPVSTTAPTASAPKQTTQTKLPSRSKAPADATATTVAPAVTARRQQSPDVQLIKSTPTNAAAHYRLQEEKARALFAKYNLALEPGEWASTRAAKERDWVEKQVRIRVHRSCHRCQTSFGTEKVCSKCTHTRCKKCPRFPDKPSERKEKTMLAVVVDSDPKYQGPTRKARIVPTMMSKGGQEMVRKAPQHRVRRTCHKCNMLFAGRATECVGCQHTRCSKCPREPAKTKKFPEGYPGDQEETFPLVQRRLKVVRQRVRWQCHDCEKYFLEHERICNGCQHERCDQCTRQPPKKVRSEPDPAVLRSLEEKLARTQLSPAAT